MDTPSLIAFLTGGSLVASLLVGLLKSALDQVNDRYGALVTQGVLLAICMLIAGVMTASSLLPQAWVIVAGEIFLGAIGIYEVVYKAVWQKMIRNG